MQLEPSYATIVEHRFERGWYSSHQVVTLEGLPAPLGPMRVTIHSTIHHGPICGISCFGLARVDSRITFDDRVQPAVERLFGSAEPLSIVSRFGFFGGGSAAAASPAFRDRELEDGAHVSWGGLAGTFSYGGDGDSYETHVSVPRATYSSAAGKRVEINDADLSARLQRALGSLYVGATSLRVARLSVSGADGVGVFTVDDVLSESSSSASHGFMTLTVKSGTGVIATAPLTLNSVHWDLTLRHLDLNSLEQLTKSIRETNAHLELSQAQRAVSILQIFKDKGAAVLARQPEISLDRVTLASSKGEATLTGSVSLRGVAAADFAQGTDLEAIVQKLDVKLNLTLDDALSKSLPGGVNVDAQLRSLAERGFLKHDSGKYYANIVLLKGQATSNGKPFQPDAARGSQPAQAAPEPARKRSTLGSRGASTPTI